MTSTLTQAMDSDRDIGTSLAEYHVDPYEIAYLRGGSLEYLKLRLFELMQMGCLIVIEEKRWFGTNQRLVLSPDFQNWHELTPPDQHLLTFFRTPRTSKETRDLAFPQEFEDACTQYRQELKQRRLLSGRLAPEARPYKFVNAALVLIFFLALIMAVLMHFRHLLPAAIFATIAFSLILHYCLKYRITREGKQYLEKLRGQFESLARSDSATQASAPHRTQLTAVAVFGLGFLAGSPFDALAETLGASTSKEYGTKKAGGQDSDGGCGVGCGGCGVGCGGCGACGV